jgi:hypothetical protein
MAHPVNQRKYLHRGSSIRMPGLGCLGDFADFCRLGSRRRFARKRQRNYTVDERKGDVTRTMCGVRLSKTVAEGEGVDVPRIRTKDPG